MIRENHNAWEIHIKMNLLNTLNGYLTIVIMCIKSSDASEI